MKSICILLLLCSMYGVTSSACTCKDPKLCQPLETPMPNREIYTFLVTNDNWKMYDWTKVTTIATFAPVDPELVCYAHSRGVRVVPKGDFPVANLTNESDIHKWVQQQINIITTNYYDGINVDFEDPIPKEAQKTRDGLTLLMSELYSSLKAISPHYQISFDTSYYPETTYRAYDYVKLADAVDFFMIMAYDISWMFKAWANSPYNTTIWGVQQFIKEGIPPSKLVLGLPWYGYNYPCTKLVNDTCYIEKVPFRGVECSDAAGSQVGYGAIVEEYEPLAISGIKYDKVALSPYFNFKGNVCSVGSPFGGEVDYKLITTQYLPQATGTVMFDDVAKSPYFDFKDNQTGQMHQMWYDDPKSLIYKYQFAVDHNLRGVGMWNADSLDYSNNTQAKEQTRAMWAALPRYN